MEYDIERMNNSIARYFCNVIHGTIAGSIGQNIPNRFNSFKHEVDKFITTTCTTPKVFVNHMKNVINMYNSSQDVVSVDIFIDNYVSHYSFNKVYTRLSGAEKLQYMMNLLFKALISYAKWIYKSDNYGFLNTNLTTDQCEKMRLRLERKLRHNGVIVQFSVYQKGNDTVPKNLFDRLRKEFNKLKEQSDN
jgi:hypothetical protein